MDVLGETPSVRGIPGWKRCVVRGDSAAFRRSLRRLSVPRMEDQPPPAQLLLIAYDSTVLADNEHAHPVSRSILCAGGFGEKETDLIYEFTSREESSRCRIHTAKNTVRRFSNTYAAQLIVSIT